MNSKNIVLIGFMGSGKSSTSRVLGKTLNRSVVSTDDWIIQKEKQLIAKIFESKGEAYFRQVERAAVEAVSKDHNQIIDCGGGVIKDSDNVADLKKNSILIYLKTSPQWIYSRTKYVKTRPLLNVEDPLAEIQVLLKEREPMYQSAADFIVDTNDKTPEQVAGEIVNLLKMNS